MHVHLQDCYKYRSIMFARLKANLGWLGPVGFFKNVKCSRATKTHKMPSQKKSNNPLAVLWFSKFWKKIHILRNSINSWAWFELNLQRIPWNWIHGVFDLKFKWFDEDKWPRKVRGLHEDGIWKMWINHVTLAFAQMGSLVINLLHANSRWNGKISINRNNSGWR